MNKWEFQEWFGFDGYERFKHEYWKVCQAARNCNRHKFNNRVWTKWHKVAMKNHLKVKALRKSDSRCTKL